MSDNETLSFSIRREGALEVSKMIAKRRNIFNQKTASEESCTCQSSEGGSNDIIGKAISNLITLLHLPIFLRGKLQSRPKRPI